VYGVKLA
jgi:hypothetical protein